jgi:hypothetical protein
VDDRLLGVTILRSPEKEVLLSAAEPLIHTRKLPEGRVSFQGIFLNLSNPSRRLTMPGAVQDEL